MIYIDFWDEAAKGESFIIDNLWWTLYYLKEGNLSQITQREIESIIEGFEESYKEKEPLNGKDTEMLTEKLKLWNDRIKNELIERI